PALARSLVEKPDDYITYASSAATAQMRVEDPEYAEHVGKIFARFRRLPEKTALRKIGAEHIKKIALVDGIVVRTTQVKPTIVRAEKQTVGERGRLRTFNIYLDANFVDVVGKETEVVEITPEDEKQILEAAQDPWVQRKLVMSLAPSIYGYEDVKEGILYLLFGGTAKQLPDGVNIRGDENVLLIGDPGCLIGDERIVLG